MNSRPLQIASCLVALTSIGRSQTAAPAFEVASIRPAPPSADAKPGQMLRTPGRISLASVSIQNLLAQAYRVKNFQISGPGWLDTGRFDIEAKLPAGAVDDQLPAMLQSLLRDRFKLALHRESRTMTALILSAAKGGPKLKAVDEAQAGGVQTSKGPLRRHLSGRMGMIYLAGLLSNMLDQPVVDTTQIKGVFDIDLDWSADDTPGENPRAVRPGDPPSLFTVLQEKLGLRLESGRAPVEIYIIDHIERVPTEN